MMAGKGISYWESVWNEAEKSYNEAKKSNSDLFSDSEKLQNDKRLYIINKMLKRYTTLCFTTYGEALHNAYFLKDDGFSRFNSNWLDFGTYPANSAHSKQNPCNYEIVKSYDGSQHFFYSYKNENEKKLLEQFQQRRQANSNKTMHAYFIDSSKDERSINIICKDNSDFQKLMIPANVKTALKHLREYGLNNKPIYENGDIHQILQVITKKTGTPIEEMGFRIIKKPSIFDCFLSLFYCSTRKPLEKKPETSEREVHTPLVSKREALNLA